MDIKTTSNIFEQYKIVKSIGKGGFSKVYLVEMVGKKAGPKYALKYLSVGSGSDYETAVKRFKQEVSIYKQINSTRVAKYIDSHLGADENYILMEYVDGESLKEKLTASGKLTPRTAVYYAMQIAEGIGELHSCNIIHRDIKSHNIMITKSNEVKIIDFGLALDDSSQRLTQTLKVVGSVYYMAPELCVSNNKPNVKSDVYAFGILLYEMLVGKYPITGSNASETIRKQKTMEVPSVKKYVMNCPQALANIVIKCTAKDPSKRYNSMIEIWNDLKTCLDSKNIYAKPLDLKKVKPKKTTQDVINSKKFLYVSLGILFLLLIVGLILVAVYVR